ncbi:hypothetical protein WOLCODRAFT_140092 [Wolfiporia cocos MD-104 SS10]|uniref:LSM domain-containing protein n=1 Tax=Wolfiporia cocos (strain MD-104) TaxID=742152 RepID=A0A2H3J0U3_WOLCO|nr:hypothetical protein WOLCODRAFT_140092 [Wolfiporia cocos MD-104 SS10]
MVATFILTRAFAISALLVGAFPLVSSAPVGSPMDVRTIEKRNCRILGCLFAEPDESSSAVPASATAVSSILSSVLPTPTASAIVSAAPSAASSEPTTAEELLEALDLIESALESESDSEASTATASPESFVEVETPAVVSPEFVATEVVSPPASEDFAEQDPRVTIAIRRSKRVLGTVDDLTQ